METNAIFRKNYGSFRRFFCRGLFRQFSGGFFRFSLRLFVKGGAFFCTGAVRAFVSLFHHLVEFVHRLNLRFVVDLLALLTLQNRQRNRACTGKETAHHCELAG